ncbi:MAG: hypothetical protein M0021_01830 [Clostridia bacterium]|nr:hypothetical protein [Clostridia bacterium]
MEKALFYVFLALIVGTISIYVVSSLLAMHFVGGLSDGETFVGKNYRVVLTGLVAMAVATLVLIGYAFVKTGSLWHPLLVVNGVSLVMNAACLHTMHYKFEYKISAWLSMATVFLDANLRFVVLYFLM